MAKFGLEHLVVAPITAEGTNSITYGTGSVAEHARRANITYNWIEGRINGDNVMAEYIKILQDADIEMATTELTPAVAVMLGLEKVKTAATTGDNPTPAVYTMKSQTGADVGIGFVACDLINGTKVYTGVWVHKITFTRTNDEWTTREDNIDLGEATVSGKCWPVMLDASGEAQIRDFSEFTTEAAAIAWVNGKAGISA